MFVRFVCVILTVMAGRKCKMRNVKLSKRLGFESFGMRLLFRILYPYFHCRCEIPEEMAYGEQPVVFVANHYNVFGPISFILSAPFISYSWVSEDLITPEKTEEALYPGLSNMLPYIREKHVRKLSRLLSCIVCGVLRRFGSIPVSRDEPGKMIHTIRKSIEVLKEGNNILIFPETGIPEYSLTSVTDFYSGFASLGAFFQKKTGKPLCFCPVYIDELHHIIRSGEPVYYDDNGKSIPEQADAISDTLRSRINDLAAASWGMEKQQRAPKRLGILHFCIILRILTIILIAIFLYRKPESPLLILYIISQAGRVLFNAVRDTVPATNHMTCLLSHGISILTDILVISRFSSDKRCFFLMLALIANGIVYLFSNIRTFVKTGRCTGTNYFDMLTSNLFCILCLLKIAGIRLIMIVMNVLVLSCLVSLLFSGAYCVMFNNRNRQGKVRYIKSRFFTQSKQK